MDFNAVHQCVITAAESPNNRGIVADRCRHNRYNSNEKSLAMSHSAANPAPHLAYSQGNYHMQPQQAHYFQHQQRHPQMWPQSHMGAWPTMPAYHAYPTPPHSHGELDKPDSSPLNRGDDKNDTAASRANDTTAAMYTTSASHGPSMSLGIFPTTSVDSGATLASGATMQMTQIPGSWPQKAVPVDFNNVDPELSGFEHWIGNDDEHSIIHLPHFPDFEPVTTQPPEPESRRLSETSFLSSVGGGVTERQAFEDVSVSEAVSLGPEGDSWQKNFDPAQQPNQIVQHNASPKRNSLHPNSRPGRVASVSNTPSARTSPYSINRTHIRRWSNGAYGTPSIPRVVRPIAQVPEQFPTFTRDMGMSSSMPAYPPTTLGQFQWQSKNILYSPAPTLQTTNAMEAFPGAEHAFHHHLEVPRPLLSSQGVTRMLHSNVGDASGVSHFADLSDPPDLYSSLRCEPCDPPESDMNPADPDLIPHEQDLRFGGDLYTPRWVRGHGNKREGWCGLCKPGRWLVLKNSAFWYDKSFTHGVSAASGAAFQGPRETRRMEGNLDIWEGLCGNCGDWIALVSSKKKGTTWFRHAYRVSSISLTARSILLTSSPQCHNHPKVKDGTKRRREPSQTMRARATSSASSASYNNASKDTTPPQVTVKKEPTLEQKPAELNGSKSKNSDVDEEYPYRAHLPEPHNIHHLVGFPNIKNVLTGLV